ncbi:hypothetical protein DL769_010752 [Monosporascus sp. CRB-8-3]|nr:hypothetical protein DL769_010752 [Monosporascus sp. CRB-8-3]
MRRETLPARAGQVGTQEAIVVEPDASRNGDTSDPPHGGPVQSVVDLEIARAHQGGETRKAPGATISANVSSSRPCMTTLPMCRWTAAA